MKKALRLYARLVVNVTRKLACETFGDTAELSPGPCERCVGRALAELPMARPVSPGDDLSTMPSGHFHVEGKLG